MKKVLFNFKFLVVVFSFTFFAFILPSKANAAVLSLDPISNSAPVGETFRVKLNIDTKGENTTSTDAVLIFDSNILEVVEVLDDSFFPGEGFKNVSNNEIYIGDAVRDPTDVREGEGTVAIIVFKGKKQGISDVKFDCTPGKTSDSNISKSDKNATDIIDCNNLTNGRYTIGSGVAAPTSAPTSALITTIAAPIAARPTIPVAGDAETTTTVLGVGALLTILGIASKIILKL